MLPPLEGFEISAEEFENPKSEILGMRKIVEEGIFEHAPSRGAEFPVGIDYRAPWETEWLGVQSAARRHARALSKTGLPVWLVSLEHSMEYIDDEGKVVKCFSDHTNLSPLVRAQVGHLLTRRHAKSLLAIEHRVFSPNSIMSLVFPARMQSVDPAFVRRVTSSTILFTVLERSKPDNDTKRVAFSMSNLGEVWVPCQRNRQVLIDSGVPAEQVAVIPHPVAASDPLWEIRPQYAEKWVSCRERFQANDRYRLINVGKWEPRKGQHELLGAFLSEFKPSEPVELVLKYASFGEWQDYPDTPQASIAIWLEDEKVKANGWTIETITKSVRLFGKQIPRLDLVKFLQASDIYVSAGRAEGFDMPALDAKLLGLRLVVMGHGGAEDFATNTDLVWDSPMGPTHPGYGWDGATWAAYRVRDLQIALRMAVNAEMDGRDRQQIDSTPYTEKAVGEKMLSQCMKLIQKLGGDPSFEPVEDYLNA